MSPFLPKGDKSLRVIIAEKAAKADHGAVLTFAELTQAIGVDDDEAGRAQVRGAVSAARPLLLGDYGRALVAVRGEGYRVALPGELGGIAQDYRRRGDRAIGKALEVIEKADKKTMSVEELKRFNMVGRAIRSLHRRMTSAEDRIADLEEAVFGPPKPVIQGKVEKEEG